MGPSFADAFLTAMPCWTRLPQTRERWDSHVLTQSLERGVDEFHHFHIFGVLIFHGMHVLFACLIYLDFEGFSRYTTGLASSSRQFHTVPVFVEGSGSVICFSAAAEEKKPPTTLLLQVPPAAIPHTIGLQGHSSLQHEVAEDHACFWGILSCCLPSRPPKTSPNNLKLEICTAVSLT